ncbi:MAG: hypothetical protein ABIO85_04235 [Sphingomicrobium sp.]
MTEETAEQVRLRQAEHARMLKIRMTRPEDVARQRQRQRSLITALLLGAFVVLVFGISVAQIKLNW